jgi:putative ABC transport system permease protein
MDRAFLYAVRRLRRGWKSGELLILALALTVAVAAMSTVSLFFGSMRLAIASQTGETMGSDVMFSSRSPIPPDLKNAAPASGVRTSQAVTFASVVLHGETTALASIKAVEPGYPLRGTLRISDEPFGAARGAGGIPARGEAWVDLRLWQELRLSADSPDSNLIQAGALTLKVRALITEEPGRGTGFTDLAPRVLIHHDDVAASGLLGPGSRAQYQWMVAGDSAALEPLLTLELPRGVRRVSPQEARPELMEAVENAYAFLALARLAATLLAAAAIALCAWQWGQKLRDEVALLKCLGASNAYILDALTMMLLLLGAAAALAGALIGLGAQEVLAALLESLMQITLPAPPLLLPLARAAGLALVLLFGFALPPILQARATPPIRVFQRDQHIPSRRLPMAAAAAAVGATLWLQTASWEFASIILGSVVAVALVLAALGWLLVLGLAPLKRAVGTSWRFGLGNVARRRFATVAQVVALGLSLQALLLVTIVRQDLLSTWRAALPPDTPNQFLINIQAAQIPALREFFLGRGLAEPRFWPMARGRLTHLRGEAITADSFKDDPRGSYWVNRDFNLSWTATLNDDNQITDGEWWGAAGTGKPLLSADKSAVEGLQLKLGDTLTLDFAGTPIEFTVHNFRTVKWDSFRPNFFLLAPPGVLEDQAAAQWLTSFYLAHDQRGLLRELIMEFPNVTVLDIETLMNQVRAIMDRIVRAVEFIFLFTLAAGLTVLLAAIEATRDERVREVGLLRALGARSGLITRGLLAEYAVLGLLAGTVAAIAAQTVAWLLAEQVLKIPYGPRPLLWLAGTGLGAGLVALLGWLSLRGTLKTPPHQVLRSA